MFKNYSKLKASESNLKRKLQNIKKENVMTDTEFFTRKNKIVKRVTGVVLIPDDQIVETGMKQIKLGFGEFNFDLIVLGNGICPYCIYFYNGKKAVVIVLCR